METLKPHFTSPLNLSSSNRFTFSPLTTYIIKPKLLHKTPFCFRSNQTLKISSKSGQRRNSLRKKLHEQQQKVRPLIDSQSLIQELNEIKPNLDKKVTPLSEIRPNLEEKVTSLDETEIWGNEIRPNLEQKVTPLSETEIWGNGSGPIFTVYTDSDGNVKTVCVNEDEILRRSGVQPLSARNVDKLDDDLQDVSSKMSRARRVAKEIENGEYEVPKDSDVVKFVVESQFSEGVRGVSVWPGKMVPVGVGFAVFCGCLVLYWSAKKVFGFGSGVVMSEEEKEMLRRKMKARVEREEKKMERGNVEVVGGVSEPFVEIERPRLDKQELMNKILKAKSDKPALLESGGSVAAKSRDFDDKVMEIKEMARQAREIERREKSSGYENDEEEDEEATKEGNKISGESSGSVGRNSGVAEIVEKSQVAGKRESERLERERLAIQQRWEKNHLDEKLQKEEDIGSRKSKDIYETTKPVSVDASLTREAEFNGALPGKATEDGDSGTPTGSSLKDHDASEIVSPTRSLSEGTLNIEVGGLVESSDVIESSIDLESLDSVPVNSANGDSTPEHINSGSVEFDDIDDTELDRDDFEIGDTRWPRHQSSVDARPVAQQSWMEKKVDALPVDQQSWMEKNYQEFEPVVQKIQAGFRENYMVAKEKVQDELNLTPELSDLRSDENDGELDWMEDDSLREIVFQVRENELMGRDPFYMMDADDKRAFFKGLEKKVEKTNAELSKIHEYIHSKVENLDYGADGISVHDPPEKIIPRWKGPPVERNPEFLNNYVQENKEFLSESMGMSSAVNKDVQETLEKSMKSDDKKDTPQQGSSFNSKTVIESSDGSRRAAKKSGKEPWQHTKKWSQGFLDSYNAETDPEVKAVMEGMGKDLDRWISEKEIKETAELMTKIHPKRRKAIEKKLDKLKKEMEYFGPQAVVSKYREYGEEKEEDYLWWLDLPYVLCIELYREEDGVQKAGFYSLEMAEDLKLNPKQPHVIAFEDPKDSKNFCYIIQAHMEMLGNGTAFVVARPPKDAYRDAKGNGFSVTVIRKGELSLNVDQPLEEVEEQISEIGSKIYHDKIMRERSVNIHSLMKGVFGSGKPSQRRRSSKRTLKKPNES